MNQHQTIRVRGRIRFELRDALGQLKDRWSVPNLVVNSGLYHIADRLADLAQDAMSHMAVGTDDTSPPAAGDTALGAEVGRVALDSVTRTDNEIEYVATFPPGVGTDALVEAGIFNDDTAGEMLCRATYAVKTKAAGDTLVVTWTLTISAT